MGIIYKNQNKYGKDSNTSLVYLSARTISDEKGIELTKDYLTLASLSALDLDKIFVNGVTEQAQAGFHNSFFRGKDITSKVTDGSLWTTIGAGNFTDLFVGDYFAINGRYYVIAGFDIYYNNGDTPFQMHHAVCLPDFNHGTIPDQYTSKQMNTTNTTTGGYQGSAMYKTYIPAINTLLTTDFGTHLCSHRELLSSEMNTGVRNGPNPGAQGASSNWSWQSVQACLMTEVEVLGATLGTSSGYDIGTGKIQLPLFKFNTNPFNKDFWTRCVYMFNAFTYINSYGMESWKNASDAIYALVRFCIKG